MRLPIPDDWDLETFICYRIFWPDSPAWRYILNGIITQYRRGATWDGKTGQITSGQEQGSLIFEANEPINTCNDGLLVYLNWLLGCLGLSPTETLPETCEDVSEIFGGEDCQDCENDSEDDCMANVTNLRCTDGWLEMERCCQWTRLCYIGEMLGLPDPSVPGIGEQDYKCNFAGAYTRHFVLGVMLAIAGQIHAALYSSDQVAVDQVKVFFPSANLNSMELFTAIRTYRLYEATVTSELLTFQTGGNEEAMRCLLYNSIKDAPDNDPIYAVSPEEVAAMILIAKSWSAFSASTSSVVYHILRALSFLYVKNTLGNYTELAFDCTCGEESPLSPQSGNHGANGWFMSAGLEGGLYQSTNELTWPLLQVCTQLMNIWEIDGYGFAFDVEQISLPPLVFFNNLSLEQQCSGQVEVKPQSSGLQTVIVGKHIVCHETMYAYLGNDAADYTLHSANYPIVPASGNLDHEDVAKISFRADTSGTPFYARIRNFRFIHCQADII